MMTVYGVDTLATCPLFVVNGPFVRIIFTVLFRWPWLKFTLEDPNQSRIFSTAFQIQQQKLDIIINELKRIQEYQHEHVECHGPQIMSNDTENHSNIHINFPISLLPNEPELESRVQHSFHQMDTQLKQQLPMGRKALGQFEFVSLNWKR